MPRTRRAIRTFRHPKSNRTLAEQSLMLGVPHSELEPNALIAAEQWKKTMRRGGRDELESPILLKFLERTDDVSVERIVKLEESAESLAPVAHDRNEMRVVTVRHLGFSFVTGLESLRKKLSQLALENRTHQLIGEDRRDADSNRRCDFLFGERLKRVDQRQVRIDRSFCDPIAAVWPATVIEHVRQVTVKRENEIHIAQLSGFARARARRYI